MKTAGKFVFPENCDEARDWEPVERYCALARRVLCVAHTRVEGTWSAYCDAVPGQRHELETEPVLAHGCKLDESVARALFPQFEGVPYAR